VPHGSSLPLLLYSWLQWTKQGLLRTWAGHQTSGIYAPIWTHTAANTFSPYALQRCGWFASRAFACLGPLDSCDSYTGRTDAATAHPSGSLPPSAWDHTTLPPATSATTFWPHDLSRSSLPSLVCLCSSLQLPLPPATPSVYSRQGRLFGARDSMTSTHTRRGHLTPRTKAFAETRVSTTLFLFRHTPPTVPTTVPTYRYLFAIRLPSPLPTQPPVLHALYQYGRLGPEYIPYLPRVPPRTYAAFAFFAARSAGSAIGSGGRGRLPRLLRTATFERGTFYDSSSTIFLFAVTICLPTPHCTNSPFTFHYYCHNKPCCDCCLVLCGSLVSSCTCLGHRASLRLFISFSFHISRLHACCLCAHLVVASFPPAFSPGVLFGH